MGSSSNVTGKYWKSLRSEKNKEKKSNISILPHENFYHNSGRKYMSGRPSGIEKLEFLKSLLSSGIFTSTTSVTKSLVPKLFDRVFFIPVDPDSFEIDEENSTVSNEFLNSITEVISEDSPTSSRKLKLKSRNISEGSFSSINYFVTISNITP